MSFPTQNESSFSLWVTLIIISMRCVSQKSRDIVFVDMRPFVRKKLNTTDNRIIISKKWKKSVIIKRFSVITILDFVKIFRTIDFKTVWIRIKKQTLH